MIRRWRSWQALQLEECQGESRRRCSQVQATMAALRPHDHIKNKAVLSTHGTCGHISFTDIGASCQDIGLMLKAP